MPSATASAPVAPSIESQVKVQQAVRKVTSLATLPEVTAQIIRTVEDRNSSAGQLHKIVSHDPALVTRILKVVNSAFYGLPGQIGSIERAIVLLGLNAVKNIAVAASLGQMFRGASLCSGFTAKDLWTHCVAVGVAARDLARQMGVPLADEAFLAGMIHDLGVLVSLQIQPELTRVICEQARTTGRDFCMLEQESAGFDHQQLGMALAEQWKFPRPCQLVAGYHHHPAALSDSNRLLVTIVYAADTLCCQTKHGFNLTACHQTLDAGHLGDIEIEPEMIQRTTTNLDNLMSIATGLLG